MRGPSEETLKMLGARLWKMSRQMDGSAGSLPPVLTRRLAAREMHVSLSELGLLIRTGQVQTCIGTTRLLPRAAVLRWKSASRGSRRRM
jgi:hypothetical protein